MMETTKSRTTNSTLKHRHKLPTQRQKTMEKWSTHGYNLGNYNTDDFTLQHNGNTNHRGKHAKYKPNREDQLVEIQTWRKRRVMEANQGSTLSSPLFRDLKRKQRT